MRPSHKPAASTGAQSSQPGREALQRRASYHVGRVLRARGRLCPLHIAFSNNREDTFKRALEYLKKEGFVKVGQVVTIVQSGKRPIWRDVGSQ